MHRRASAAFGLTLIALLATACSDTGTSPSTPANTVAFASGSGGGTGGGGTGGGGTGGGGGTTTTAGRIAPASGAASCDAGTSIGISLDRGNQNRINISLGFTAAPTVGPNGETSLGGWWNVRLTDENGNGIGGVGSNVGATTPSMGWTFLGGTVTPGAHTITFSATNTYLAPGTAFPAAGAPLLETCTATIPVFAR
jgi:hypothetical protein